MTSYDLTPDDDPLDLEAVTTDDALVQRLRQSLSPEAAVVWDDNDDEDPGYALLRALQLEVSTDLPVDPIVPSEITRLLPRRRHLSRSATVAVVAASVLSIGGVAAASAPGQPLAGVRHAVSDAVSTAVAAMTPDSPVGPTASRPTESATPTPKPTPPGDAVSDAARSASAILQIEANLDRAARLLDDGRLSAAKAQLDAAARKLGYVTDAAEHARLGDRLAALQARLAAAPTAQPTHGPRDDKANGKGGTTGDSHRPSGKPTPGSTHAPTAPPAGSRSHSSRGASLGKVRSEAGLPGDNGPGGRGNSDGR
ncbi:MAG: hypothetical protein QOJ79_529 [Actinomycetota bacterium]|jgi:hypothetical protein|nr:hypothetical protein [Actinomycetota bacterium]